MHSVIKVMIVDDDSDWRDGLRQFLSYDREIEIVGEAHSRETALEMAQRLDRIDVVLMDINLSGMLFDGIDVMLAISEVIDCKFIMLTSMQSKEVVQEAFTSGATNYITKQYVEAIPQAIKDAYQDQSSIHHSASDVIRSEWVRLANKVTDREVEILQYLRRGYTFRQISEALNLEEQSVKNHLGKLSKKLGYSRFNRFIIERARRWGWFR